MVSQKKRILFFIPTLMHGGAEHVLVNLANNMDFDKYDVTVMTIMNTGHFVSALSPKVHYKHIFPCYLRGTTQFFMLFSPKLAYKLFIGDKYDIIVSYLEGTTTRILSGCSDPNVKKVAWVHIEMESKAAFSDCFRSYEEALSCYKKFDKIVCVSETVKQCFDEVSGLGDKSIVLYNTNETAQILERMQEPVDDIEFADDCVNIVSVAKLSPTKGFDRLAHIHKRLLDEGIKNQVYIFGTGSAKYDIEPYLKAEGLVDSFTFVGYRENPYKYVAQSDLYVCSSRREGFSTAVTEALIVGVPVVSTRCSGAEELLGSHNEYGIVTDNDEEPLYQGIKEMLTVEGNLEKYKRLAKERGKRFSTENTVKALEEMLESL